MKSKKYTLGRNVLFHLNSARQWNKWVCYFQFLDVIPNVAATFLGIWLPSLIVSMLQRGTSLKALLATTILVSSGMLVSNVADIGMRQYLHRNGLSLTLYYDKLAFEKTMRVDYDLLESPEVRKLVGNVWDTLRNEFAVRWSVTSMPVLLISVFNSAFYGALLCGIHFSLVLLLVLTMVVNAVLLKRTRDVHGRYHEELSRHTKAAAYVNRHAMERSDGKDIRIYQMQDWFLEKYDDAVSGMDRIYGKIHKQYFFRRFQELGFGFAAELLSYGYLAYLLAEGRSSASEFVFSVGLVRTFMTSVSALIGRVQDLNNVHAFLTYIRKLLDLPEKAGKEAVPTDGTKGLEIVFRDVSFRYPGAEAEVLSHVNLTIRSNEKLALIGLNGAGKTTFVKLLCGFYKPTKGEILVNGIPQGEYDRDAYVGLVSALFQDSMLFPVTVDENLTGAAPTQADSASRRTNAALAQTDCAPTRTNAAPTQADSAPTQTNAALAQTDYASTRTNAAPTQVDADRLAYVLKLSGFGERYESLPRGGGTELVREVNEKATDLSGGEKQKLLFARALYKKAPLLILDEPTAALDPIAENELYLRYGEAARNRTVVFISHRLSSTRFCDRIALLEGGRILEEGTHEALLAKKGRYAELYEMQSKYYREEAGR